MDVARLITADAFTVTPEDSLDKAIALMEEHHIRHLPVVEGRHPVGMLSDRDLLVTVGWRLEVDRSLDDERHTVVGPRTVREVMTQPVVTIGPGEAVHTAARMMAERRFHALPVVRDGVLVGVVTSTDILSWYARDDMAGIPRMGERVSKRMHASVQSIGPREPLHAASKILHDLRIRHLPVASGRILMGILSDRDVRRECGADAIEDEKAQAAGGYYIGATTVMDVMTRKVETATERTTMREAMRTMTGHRIGCLPVVRGEELVGLITETDCLRFVAMVDEDVRPAGGCEC